MNPARTLTCTTTVDGDTARIEVDGDITYTNGDRLPTAVGELFAAHPVRRLHLDLAGLGFCDSSGLGALLGVLRIATATGAELHLENRPPSLDRLLRRTRTFDHLTRSADRERKERLDH
ncbi:STAS domain-containing protein [Saccharothrix syringae]|uniref:Anti-sigma factor antagonist n=1 Tax=Saccharothrix syringae TaxID=103733 RepID=A0A5Q0GZF1_SACSY|nr:STAS domain-containing protein [Saccharothrix syringae]QFZ19233.1 anti-sigma factor antagonist [Saccharothrix syringae]